MLLRTAETRRNSRSQTLTTIAFAIDCNRFMPTYFELQRIWHQLLPISTRVDPLQILTPHQKPTWKYEDLQNILNHEIYRPEELERLHDYLILNAERPAILESIARRVSNSYQICFSHKPSNDFYTICSFPNMDPFTK